MAGKVQLVLDYDEAGFLRRVVRQAVTSWPVAWLSVRFLPGLDSREIPVIRLTPTSP